LKLKKSINHKSNIKIKFRLHHWIPHNKNFEIRSHLTIFWQTFLFIFFIKVIYTVIARTKRIKWQNKREQVRTNLYVFPNNKCGVRTNQNKGQDMLLLWTEQHITKARTIYYYSRNKFVWHLEKKCRNKSEQLLKQNPIIVGTILCVILNKNKCSVKTNQNKC
jgi:hypothetical protein